MPRVRPHDPATAGSPAPGARPRASLVARARAELAPVRRRAAVVAAAAAVWAVWASGPGWSTPALLVAAVGGAALGVVDARTHRLPNALLFPTAATAGGLLVLAAVAGGDLAALLRAAVGAAALGLGYLLLHLLDRSGLGLGDVKLAVLLGAASAWYGWGTLAAAALLPFLVGGLVAVALLVARRANRRTALAFGPYMLVGAALAISAARLGA